MLLLGSVAPWMLLVFLGPHLSLSSASVRSKTRGADRSVVPQPGRAQRSENKVAAIGGGKFTLKDKMQCTWTARDARGAVRLLVKCENPEARVKGGTTEMKCEYTAKPQSCPGFQSDPKSFWKQVARALKRLQGKVCRDERALVKAGMCKRAPRDAHFKLDINSAVISAQSGDLETTPTPPQTRTTSTTTQSSTRSSKRSSTSSTSVRPSACSGGADHRKTAEEYCSSSWASVCSFFFSVLQNDC
ncbi:fibroblast growth factor-binding protein 1-like [Solea solea]|uniref:fibroblast growth factor-binding protein 1-like n=1 Tax=Solea solea TaxID=90069 RepID=UPI00272BC0C5|nr:fibroblast growth factor-binding protein 1-like [Solea solea]